MNIYAVGLALAGFDEQAGTAFVRVNSRRSVRREGGQCGRSRSLINFILLLVEECPHAARHVMKNVYIQCAGQLDALGCTYRWDHWTLGYPDRESYGPAGPASGLF
jgi:hypothetical protein